MPTPFPGMDPYLEQPGIWQQVHTTLIVEIQHFLSPLLRPNYFVAIEQSIYLTVPPPADRVGVPDVVVVAEPERRGATTSAAMAVAPRIEPVVAQLPQTEEIKHRHLEIRHVETQTVVTTIEILSPANKIGRKGREQYEQKRIQILDSRTHLVEIDLLRGGEPMPMRVPYQKDYRIIVSRSQHRPQAAAYLFSVRDVIPDIPIPLRPDDAEPTLPLNQLLHDLYDKAGYDLMIDYEKPLSPPLSEEDAVWAEEVRSEK